MKISNRKILAFILAFTMLFGMTVIGVSAEEDTKTYYFSNNKGWESVYVHCWDAEKNDITSWSIDGFIKTEYIGYNGYNEGIYSFELPASAAGMVITAGESGPQTVDIDLTAESYDGFYLSEEGSDGKWSIGTYAFDPSGVTEGEVPGGGSDDSSTASGNTERDVTVVLKNSLGWDTVCVYYWPAGGSSSNWPGEPLEAAEDGLYYAVIPAGNGYVIFNNGNGGEGNQTADLVIPTDDNILFDNGTNEWSEKYLEANNPEDNTPKMTFLQKVAKVILICLKTIEKFFKDLFVKK